MLEADDTHAFRSEIWNKDEQDNAVDNWLENLEMFVSCSQQKEIRIKKRSDRIKEYWIKKLTRCHKRMVRQLHALIKGNKIRKLRTKNMCLKDASKGNAVDKCSHITWLLLT